MANAETQLAWEDGQDKLDEPERCIVKGRLIEVQGCQEVLDCQMPWGNTYAARSDKASSLVERNLSKTRDFVLMAANVTIAVRVVIVAVVTAVHLGAVPITCLSLVGTTPGLPWLVPAGTVADVLLINVDVVILACSVGV